MTIKRPLIKMSDAAQRITEVEKRSQWAAHIALYRAYQEGLIEGIQRGPRKQILLRSESFEQYLQGAGYED